MGVPRDCLAACILLLLLLPSASCHSGATGRSHSEANCSKKCAAEHCNTIGIRYGKYCGVGYTGCAGEKPCDELDACCKTHDECVEKKGMLSTPCHQDFKNCIIKVKKSGKTGFSKECPYRTAMPTMVQGMDMAILFSQLGSQKEDTHANAKKGKGSANSPAAPPQAAKQPNGAEAAAAAAASSPAADADDDADAK